MTLDEYITHAGTSGRAIAAEVGMDEYRLSRIRRGKIEPSLSEALAIVKASGGKVKVETMRREAAA